MKIQDIMQSSGVAFGTSGARGLVSAMTDQVCFAYTQAFLRYLREIGEYQQGQAVAIAGDLRPSTPRILRACAAAIIAEGGQVDYCGYVPSPAVALYGFSKRTPSLMVTGSHIPDDRNGIKFNRPQGELLKSDEAGILAQVPDYPSSWFDDNETLQAVIEWGEQKDTSTAYVQRYRDFFGVNALTGMTVGVYQHSAVGRDLLVTVFEELGASVIALGRTATFTPVDTEAIRPEDIALAAQWAKEYQLDAIVSTDGDSDRPLLANAQGEWLRGDILGILTAKALDAHTVVTPVSSNTALERIQAFPQVIRTKIGSPYVIAAMTTAQADDGLVCGFEANGGFLTQTDCLRHGKILKALPTRDAVLPIVAVLAEANQRQLSVAALVTALPQRYTHSDRIKNFPTALAQAKLSQYHGESGLALQHFSGDFAGIVGSPAITIDLTDGIRVTFANNEIVHLRPSGNAPELRCYTESHDAGRVQILCEACLAKLHAWLSP